MTVVGEAFVKVSPDDRGFAKKFSDDVSGDVKKSAGELGRDIGEALAGGIVLNKVRQVITGSLASASDLNESISKTEVVFGNSSKAVLQFGEDSATALGQSENQALTAASTFGNLFRSIGLSEGQSAQFSTSLTKLGSDLASFNNTSVDDALEALRSGIVGETEPLKRFGVNLNEASLKAEALRLGLGDIGPTLTASQKAQAAYSLIMKQTTLAQGDFERTSDGAANSQRILAAQLENSKAKLGENLLPTYQRVLGVANDLLGAFNELPGPIRNTVVAAGGLGVVFGVAAPTLFKVKDLLGEFSGGGGGGVLAKAGDGVREFAGTYKGLRDYGLGVGDSLKGASNQVGGLTGVLSPATLAVGGLTAAVGIGLGVYAAWAKNVARVREETEALSEALIDQKGNVQQTLIDQASEILTSRDSFDESARAARLTPGQLAAMVGADPQAFDDFRKFMQKNFGEQLDTLGKEGTLGEGQVFGSRALSLFSDEIPDSIEPTIRKLLELHEEGKLTENQFKEIIDAGADLSKEALGTSQNMALLTGTIRDQVDVGRQSADIQKDFKTALGGTGISLEDQQAALLRLAEAFPRLAAAEGLVVDAAPDETFDATADSASAAADAMNDYADALTGTFDPVFAAINAQNKLAQAQSNVGKKEQALAEARRNAGKESREAAEAVQQANVDVAAAQADVVARQADLDSQIAKRGAGSDAARAAAEALADAQAKVAEAQGKAAETQGALGEAQRKDANSTDVIDAEQDLADAKLSVVEAAVDQEASLARLNAAMQDGTVNQDTFTTSLKRWQEQGIITAEQAQIVTDKFTGVGWLAATLDGTNVQVKVTADTQEATDKINAINALIDQFVKERGLTPFERLLQTGALVDEAAGVVAKGGAAIGRRVDAGQAVTIREQGLPEIAVFGDQGQVLGARNKLTEALLGPVEPGRQGSGGGNVTYAAGAIQIQSTDPVLGALELVRQQRAEAWRMKGASV